jgi:uncharacterized RDD family membrane protein YckC
MSASAGTGRYGTARRISAARRASVGILSNVQPPEDPWSYPPPPAGGYPQPPAGGYPEGGYTGGGYPGGGYPGGGYGPAAGPGWGDPAPGFYLAGWWSRVGATLVDTAILLIPILLISFLGGRAGGTILAIVVEAAYFTYMLSQRGQTVGNMAVGTRVVDARTGGPISPGRALGRWAAQVLFGIGVFLLFIPLLLDYLWPLWDPRNQTLHDKIASTVVVRS